MEALRVIARKDCRSAGYSSCGMFTEQVGVTGMTRIKICGLTRKEDIDAVNAACPDYTGFVFAESKRRIDVDRAMELKSLLDPSIKAAGVFVNEDIRKIIRLCDMEVIDLIQLHGDEDADYIKKLREYTSNRIIKAFRVRTQQDIESAKPSTADYILLDAFQQGKYGGVGKTFDWSMVSGIDRPYFLAGGIDESNVAQAIREYRPFCVDVSSGVETGGCKDPRKIKNIVERVRRSQCGADLCNSVNRASLR